MPVLPWSAAHADPAKVARARLLGATSPHALGFEVERFEYVVASESLGLVRLQGAWATRPPPLARPALIVSHPDGTLRSAALPDPTGWAVRAPTGEWRWHLGFAVELSALLDDRSAFALNADGELLISLPEPGRRELCEPELLEAVSRRRGRSLSLVGAGLAIVALAPMSLAPGSLAGEEIAAAQGVPAPAAPASAPALPPCPPTGVLPDGTHCTPDAGSQAPGSAPAPTLSPAPPPQAAPPPTSPQPLTQTPPSSKAPPAPAGKPDQQHKAKHPQPLLHAQEKHRAAADDAPVRLKPRPRAKPAHPKRTPGKAKPNLSRTNAAPWTLTPPSSSIPSFTAPAGVPNFFIDSFRIPPFLLPIYQAAGTEYGIPWQLLAAINEIESDYGRNLAVSSAGALGWMQFIPSTWQAYGVDANGDGKKDPYNPVDAIFAAARYLKAAGGDKDVTKAIFAYNHADWYVQSVLVRAKLIGAMPADLVGSLTGLTEGHFPVASSVRYAGRLPASTRRVRSANAAVAVDAKPGRKAINIFSRPRAPVIAVNDGVIQRIGRTRKRGLFLVLQDVYGNRYTYSHLGSIVKSYPAPKPQPARSTRRDSESPPRDPHPHAPASAGTQRPGHAPKPASRSHATSRGHATSAAKERLFAYPARPAAFAAGGRRQIEAKGMAAPDGYDVRAHFSVPVNLQAKDVVIKPMRPGARVIGGTILARVRSSARPGASRVTFAVRPAGKGAPKIDPKPILDGWRLLEATDIYRGRAKRAGVGGPDGATIGQILLMSKETLARRVLSDPRIGIYECGRRDIAAGAVDRRVLATLAFLASVGLRPNVSTLKCGHSYFTSAGTVSEHSFGAAVDIVGINGIPVLGHQGPGSVTDVTVRRLLTLQGAMQPNQLITLMDYPGVPYAWSQGDHADHIHIGFPPRAGAGGALSSSSPAVLKPGQWTKLIDRLGQIDNPVVLPRPSRYALPAGH